MSPKTGSPTLGSAVKALGDLVGEGAKIGMGLLGSIPLPSLKRDCGCNCDIPPPCWMPQSLDEVTTRVCPGSKAVVRVNITNCGMSTRTIEIESTDKAVVVEPPSLTLGPFEEGVVALSLEVPATASEGEAQKIMVRIRGCKEYVLRWTVEVTCKNESCCTDVNIEDCPDLVHHWYDHFYCQRACPHQR